MHPGHGFVAALLAVLIAALPALAESATTPRGAEMFIQELGSRTFSVLRQKSDVSETERMRRLCDLLLKRVDFDHLAKFSMGGRLYRQGTPAMRAEFTRLFAAFVIDVAVRKFGDLSLRGFEITKTKARPPGDALVETLLDRLDGEPLKVGWRVRNKGETYKVIDMEVEGHSLGIHYRGKFERSTQSATLKGTLKSLRRWVKDSPSKPIVEQLLGSG